MHHLTLTEGSTNSLSHFDGYSLIIWGRMCWSYYAYCDNWLQERCHGCYFFWNWKSFHSSSKAQLPHHTECCAYFGRRYSCKLFSARVCFCRIKTMDSLAQIPFSFLRESTLHSIIFRFEHWFCRNSITVSLSSTAAPPSAYKLTVTWLAGMAFGCWRINSNSSNSTYQSADDRICSAGQWIGLWRGLGRRGNCLCLERAFWLPESAAYSQFCDRN